jgi:hypothetical protein
MSSDKSDIRALEEALAAIDADTRRLLEGLTAEQGVWRAEPASWSVAHCLDHLATSNRVYLRAMRPAAEDALRRGRKRRRPAVPGLIGGWFVRIMEPPVTRRFKMRAPKKIVPRESPALQDAAREFLASQDDVRAFLRAYEDTDLTGVRFVNPFAPAIRFTLATGLHVLVSHDRRHLWQAWNVRRAGERVRVQHTEAPA